MSDQERYQINGVIDANQPVMSNLTELANSCGSWISHSNELGKWGVVINRAETPTRHFTDANILGTIDVTGVGLGDLYNSVRAEFPHRDIRDETDFVRIEIASADRHPNELDNTLELSYPLINDPIQAQLLSFIELKQSRLNRTIKFQTDWSELGVVAGEVVTVTNANYGFSQEKFRVISVVENQGDDGSVILEILAMGYDDAVYDEDFTRVTVSNSDGIITIGSIGKPSTPTLTVYERDANPRVLIEGTVPTGIVTGMEVYLSTDGTNFTKLTTLRSEFTAGDDIEFEHPTNVTATLYAKTRAINDSGKVSEFSDVGTIDFTPTQTTQAIDPNTDVVDSGGNSLLGLLGANALLALLKGLMEDGDSGTGSVFDKIFDIFNTEKGVDLGDPEVLSALAQAGKIAIVAFADSTTVNNIAQSLSNSSGVLAYTSSTFQVPVAGKYKCDFLIDQNSSGARGGRGSFWGENEDWIGVVCRLKNASGTLIDSSGSGGPGAQYWTDFALTFTQTLSTGVDYYFEVYMINYTESSPTSVGSLDIGITATMIEQT